MNYLNILPCSTSDFSGISVVLAVSGCVHKCGGCWAKERGGWKYSSGESFTEEVYQYLKSCIAKPYIDNICMQGGDILAPSNYEQGLKLCRRLKQELPEKKLVIFTGYEFSYLKNDLLRSPILEVADVIVDGKYMRDLPPANFRGSSNQRILHLDEKGDIVREE